MLGGRYSSFVQSSFLGQGEKVAFSIDSIEESRVGCVQSHALMILGV